jgi:hypothetical protein
MEDNESILDSTKRQLGLDPEDDSFDSEIIMHINSVFFVLTQLGVGPTNGFAILGRGEKWVDFMGAAHINAVRTYMGLKVKLIFDPPSTGPLVAAMESQANQMEWRLNVYSEEVKWVTQQQTS